MKKVKLLIGNHGQRAKVPRMLLLLGFFWCVVGALSAGELPPKRILVISTFHLTHRWTAEFNQALQDHLHAMPQKISVDFLELNAIQRRNIDFEAKFQPYLKNIQHGDYDLLVAVLGDAVSLLENNYDRLPAELPIVCIVDQPVSEEMRRRFPSMTGTCNDVDVLKNIDLGRRLMPRTEKVLIITDDVDSGLFLYESLQHELRDGRHGAVELINGKNYTTDQVLAKTAQLPLNSFVVFAPWRNFLKDGYFSLEQVAGELQRVSPGPYFVITDVLIGKGALGGYVSRGATHAGRAAEQISRIFSGTKPRELPYITCPRELMIDMEVMRRLGLPSNVLPPDAVLINRRPPFWEIYQAECLIIGIAFCCIVMLLIFLLFYHLRFRKMSRETNFLLNHGGELAHVTYFRGDEEGNVIWIGGDLAIGIPNDGAKHALAAWVVPEDRERFRQICARVITEAHDIYNEIFTSEASGSRRLYRLLAAGKKFEDSYLVVIQDITAAQAAAEAKSYFLTSVSHEIRTPLNAIQGFSSLLRNERLSVAERREYAAAIGAAGDRLLELVNDVLDLSRLENGRMNLMPEETDFPALAESILAVFRVQDQKKKLLLQHRITPMPLLWLDPRRIRQILVHLLGNALKFTSAGQIELIAEFHAHSADTGTLSFTIADTGCGISEENQRRLFQPFVRIDAGPNSREHHGGAGLGLPICQRLVASMGGELTLESTLGQGCRVTVVLTAVRFSTRSAIPEEQPHVEIAPPSEMSVLLVDDIPLNLKVLEAMLKKRNIHVCSATSGAAALQLFDSRKVDVVLTDMWMPEMNGQELAALLRARPRGEALKIVAVTADSDVAANFDLSNFDAVLHKPMTLEKLTRVLFEKNDDSSDEATDQTVAEKADASSYPFPD